MRLIGTLNNRQHAERFAAFLTTEGISTYLDPQEQHIDVWVRDEDAVQRAAEHLEVFRNSPDDRRYVEAVDKAEVLLRDRQEKLQQARKLHVSAEKRWTPPQRPTPLTFTLIGISIVVALWTNFGEHQTGVMFRALIFNVLDEVQIAAYQQQGLSQDDFATRVAALARGEVWRLVTPIFIHFGIWHILFNMMWAFLLGRALEQRYGSWPMLGLMFWCAIPSTFLQGAVSPILGGTPLSSLDSYWISLGGGLSGVVYGWIGFAWMRSWFDPQSGLWISPQLVILAIGWMMLGFLGLDEQLFRIRMGNWAHGVGLVAGMIPGYWPKLRSDLGWDRPRR